MKNSKYHEFASFMSHLTIYIVRKLALQNETSYNLVLEKIDADLQKNCFSESYITDLYTVMYFVF